MFMNNSEDAVIRSSGTVTLSNVVFSSNSAMVDVANDGELTISGEGATLEKGISGAGKAAIVSGATLTNGTGSKINQSSITVAGTLTNNNEDAGAIVVTDKIGIENSNK